MPNSVNENKQELPVPANAHVYCLPYDDQELPHTVMFAVTSALRTGRAEGRIIGDVISVRRRLG